MLEDDQPNFGETNARTITRLLKQLEDVISNGQHAEASRLAHDLAKMRLSSMSKGSSQMNGPMHALLTKESKHGAEEIDGAKVLSGATSNEVGNQASALVNGDTHQAGGVVRRALKVDPVRREVKSDITNHGFVQDVQFPLEDDKKPFK